MKVYTLELAYTSQVSGVYATKEEAIKEAEYIQTTFGTDRYPEVLIEEWEV